MSLKQNIEENKFLYELSQTITKDQSRALVKIQELPARLEDQTPFDVLKQLKIQGRYSKLEELAAILKAIHRIDLEKEVLAYAKECKKKARKAQKESTQPPPAATSDANHFECTMQLQMAKLQHTIFMDQTRKLEEVAHEARYSRVEEIIRKDLKVLSDEMNLKLQYISKLVARKGTDNQSMAKSSSQAETRPRSSSSESISGNSSSSEGSMTSLDSEDSLYSTIDESRPTDNKSKAMATSQSPINARRVTAELPQLPNKRTSYRGRSSEVISTKTREDANIPKIDQTDSGFAEAGEFLKEEPEKVKFPVQPSSPEAAGYMSLDRNTVGSVGYYITAHKETETAEEATYSDPRDVLANPCAHSDEPIYVNARAIATNQLVKELTLKRKPQ